MKKRILALVLALALALAALPFSAAADDPLPQDAPSGENASAVKNLTSGQTFESLDAALGAASPGDTLELQEDLSLRGTLTLDKSVTIDGNGHTLSGPGLHYLIEAGLRVKNCAVTLQDMTLTGFNTLLEKGVVYTEGEEAALTAEGLTIRDFVGNAFAFEGGSFAVRGTGIDCTSGWLDGWLARGFYVGGGSQPVTGTIETTQVTSTALTSHRWGASAVDVYANASVTIESGSFTGAVNCSESASLVITGGSFSTDVRQFLAPGLTLVQENGMYTVAKAEEQAVAEVDGVGYPTLEAALAALPADGDKTLTLKADLALERMLDLNVAGMTLDLGGHTLTAAGDFSYDDAAGRSDAHLINVSAANVTIKNGTVAALGENKHCINLYKASGAVLEKLTLKHTAAGAPLVVNASAVTVKGALKLEVGPASWYGINVDPGDGSAALTFAEGASVSMTGEAAGTLDVIRLDGDLRQITVSGAEEAGLVRTGENSYGFAPVVVPTPSPTPSPTPEPAPSAAPQPGPDATPAPTVQPAPAATPAPESSPAAEPTPLPEEGAGAVTADLETHLEGDVALATVEYRALEDAVEKALAQAEAAGEAPALTLNLDAAQAGSIQVSLPAGALAALARQEGATLTVASQVGQVTFDANALSAILGQAGEELALAVGPAPADSLNQAQATAAGQFPVVELNLHSDGQVISDFEGGSASVTLPHDLPLGQSPEGVVVWYLDETGSITPCDTRYSPVTDEVTFTTTHFSKYVIAYNESLVPTLPQRPVYTLPEDARLQLVPLITLGGVAVVLLVFAVLLVQLLFTGRRPRRRR